MEDVARAVGASSPSLECVKIDGKEIHPRPLNIRELTELERMCVSAYRRSYVKTFAENADLLPDGGGESFIEKKMEEAAKFDLMSLPTRYNYDGSKIPVSDKLEAWLTENMDGYSEVISLADNARQKEGRYRLLAVSALNSKLLPESVYQELVGSPPVKTKVPYVHWWINGSFEGRFAMVWQAVCHCGVSKERFEEVISRDPTILMQLARAVETLSAPATGNG